MGLRRWTFRTIDLLAVLVAVTPAYPATITVPANGGLSGFGAFDRTRGMTFTLPTPGIGNELTVYFFPTPDMGLSLELEIAKVDPTKPPFGIGQVLFQSDTFTVPFGVSRDLIPFSAALGGLPLDKGIPYAWVTQYVGSSGFASTDSGVDLHSTYTGGVPVGFPLPPALAYAFTLDYTPALVPEPPACVLLLLGILIARLLLSGWNLPEVAEGVVYVDGVREKRGNEKAAA
jgi:hypothetical protein